MNADDVLAIYAQLTADGIEVWIDGGWCVDALLGEETRAHRDLDIAVDRKDEERLQAALSRMGLTQAPTPDQSPWNYVMERGDQRIDIHIFAYGEDRQIVYGVAYPFGSLTGTGVIMARQVRCVSPEWLFKFKTAYAPAAKDIADVQALSARFGFALPEAYR